MWAYVCVSVESLLCVCNFLEGFLSFAPCLQLPPWCCLPLLLPFASPLFAFCNVRAEEIALEQTNKSLAARTVTTVEPLPRLCGPGATLNDLSLNATASGAAATATSKTTTTNAAETAAAAAA